MWRMDSRRADREAEVSFVVSVRESCGYWWLILGFHRGDDDLGQFGRMYFGNVLAERWDVKKREASRMRMPGILAQTLGY